MFIYNRPKQWVTGVMLGMFGGLLVSLCVPVSHATPVIEVKPDPVALLVAGEKKTVTIRNVGTTDLTVGSITLVPSDSPDFQLVLSLVPKFSLAPGASASFDVVFPFKSGHSTTARVEITSNDPDTPIASVSLNENGTCESVETNQADLCREGAPLFLSTVTLGVEFVDCLTDFVPDKLQEAGHNSHTIFIWFCVHKDDNGKIKLVRLEDIALAADTFKINKCGADRDCVNADNVVQFRTDGIAPLQVQLINRNSVKTLKLTYLENNTDLNGNGRIEQGEQGLFPKVCLNNNGRDGGRLFLAGITGKVERGNFAGAFLRGRDAVKCYYRGFLGN